MGLRLVLVRSRSPGNVGSAARIAKNFGLGPLVLVDPRLHRGGDTPGMPPFFETEARRMAWRAADVLERAVTVPTLAEAVAPCTLVLAAAPHAAPRMENLEPEEAARRLAEREGEETALVFGSESSGLTAEETASCSGVVVIPTSPAYRDLNVAQSVAVLAYLAFRARGSAGLPPREGEEARHRDREDLADRLLETGRRAGFLKRGDEPVARELRAMVHRLGLRRRDTELLRSFLRRLQAKLPP
ncbi:MAG: RNA methyltransferase [Acidobacteriota bacterium]